MDGYLGDFALGAIVTARFHTLDAIGQPITLAGTPAARVRKGSGAGAVITAGVTLTVDVITGQHVVDVDTAADAAYVAGAEYSIELSAGTVSGASVVGRVLAQFSVANRAAVSAAANAAALLDVASGIETGLTFRQALRLIVAGAAGKVSGAGGATVTLRNAVADSKDRIVATVDANGNRTAVTVDLS